MTDRSGRRGEGSRPRTVTNADVAAAAGVSTMTVSRVVNGTGRVSEATRQRVRKAIDDLGYQPNQLARSLTQGRTRTIGIVVPDITNPFFPEIVRGAEDAAWAAGYTVALANAVEDQARERAALRNLAGHRVDGVIVCSPRLPDHELTDLLAAHPAAVLVNRKVHGAPAVSLMVDDLLGAHLAVGHLLGRGRTRLALLGGPDRSASAKYRREGFLAAMREAGVGVNEALLTHCEPNEEAGFEAATRWAQAKGGAPFDGIVAYNDLAALGAVRALNAAGLRVPEDVAVVGCDDIRMASAVAPSLTTLRIEKYGLGRLAVEMIFALQRGRKPADKTFAPELIVRESAP
ncbi:MAG: LacI family DNA-binding transcriptional regulator [Trueperaceae bacterium]|nr:LacI family DNA-binding transcriptional regulator [Trueperaceae bacterium]